MEGKDFCCYEFGEFRLDARRRSLSKNGEKVPLPARNFDLLLFMVENGGRILEHDELLEQVWAGTFVEQATLKKGVSALRQILQEKPETEFIKTIPRRGYSFVSPVRVVPEENGFSFVRETEREIIIEEFEETDEPNESGAPEKIIEIPSASTKALPSGKAEKINFLRVAIFSGAGILALAVIFFGLKSYYSKSVQPQFSVENVRVSRLTNNGKVLYGTVVSPDGTYLLYPTADKDGVSLWLRQVFANSATRLTPPVNGGFWAFAVAPDNSYVYYVLNNVSEPQKTGLYKMPLLGGEPQRIAESVGSFAISPDGTRILLIRTANDSQINISVINNKGENERAVTNFPANYRLWGTVWTPDGSALLCTIRKIIEDKFIYYVAEISPENGKETIILPEQERVINGAVWLPDKSAMLLTVREPNADIRQIWQYFPASQQWRRVTNDNNSYHGINLTRDGKSIISMQQSRLAAIWLSDVISPGKNTAEKKFSTINRENFRQITGGVNNFDQLGWLSDGRLVYSATEDGKETIFTMNADGANARQITAGEDGIWILPKVTGNGQNICFLSSRTGINQAWRIDADGKNLTKVTETNLSVITARILRDNSTVIYLAQTKSGAILFRQSPDGQTTQLTESATGAWAISPGEKTLAVEVLDKNTQKYHIELRSLEDGKVVKTFDFLPVHQMIFTPDGNNLAYDMMRGDASQIMLQSLDGGVPQLLIDFQTDVIFSFDWSPDGSHLAIIRGKQLNDAVSIKANNP